MTMSPLTALIMGFTFSFAWTPCVGPALASVLLMAGSAQTSAKGFLLIGVYTLGFILPFLAAGLFTAKMLGFFRKHRNAVRYTVKAGGVLMVFMGLLMVTGTLNSITGYLSSVQGGMVSDTDSGQGEEDAEQQEADAGSAKQDPDEDTDNAQQDEDDSAGAQTDPGEEDGDAERRTAAFDFELADQYGNTHRLSDYRGKVVFLNFWATWCGPCRSEMPDIQKLYEEYSAQGEAAEVVILGAAAPGMGQEGSWDEIAGFMKENGYTYPVLMDTEYEMFSWYGISAFPTTFMIDKEGYIYGYVPGQMTEEIMRSIIEQTLGS